MDSSSSCGASAAAAFVGGISSRDASGSDSSGHSRCFLANSATLEPRLEAIRALRTERNGLAFAANSAATVRSAE
eukprot:2290470-Prymnesium_polylepis.1